MSGLPQLERPFVIFISSAQQEFEDFRQELKQTIDTERWSNLTVMRARLIENQRGPVIQAEIRREIDAASVYIGIFGRQLRDWPVAEFRYAKVRGLPQLIYKYERRGRPGRPQKHRRRGRKSALDEFLESEAIADGIRVNGPYRKLQELPEIILADIAILVTEMVRENADIRKRLYTGIPV